MTFFRNLITLPGRFVRGTWRFFNPKLKVGRIPYARTTLLIQLIAALVFLGYTLTKKDTQLPFSEEPYEVQVLLDDAQGLNPTKEPAAGVAGVNNGKVTETVVAANGQALVTLSFDSEIQGKIFADATAFVRPTSALQTLIVNVDPGSPEAGPLPEGEVISAANSKSSVSIDDLTGLLNADTQAQTQVLISEAAIALKDREPELRRILAELGQLTDSATPVAEALADRRRLLVKLTDNMDDLFTTLGQRGAQLANAIDAGSDTLAVTAGREVELAEATQELAPTLNETTRALSSTRTLAESLVPALDQILPVADQVAPASEKFRELLPKLDELVETSDQLIEDGAKPVRLFSDGMKGLADRVRGDQVPALRELVDLVELLFDYRFGLLQFAENISGVASQNRNAGPFAQFAIVNAEFKPEWFGFPAAAARSKNGQPSVLDTTFAAALEKTCHQNAAACVLRFSMPGLPEKPVLDKFLEGQK
ncbi:MAG: phospholipid/cholesterol/gamma-HCH transport system substrate-binding protein [Solirubrobacterales bacterium]|jgi:phospholipid/cholesterol/gamma-HCH transport system substrate-binding protein|nr:phospholipid/cholesterol/gamma-HCH transport system substrate-binding protein [Solirubrobacterales bacterium]